MESYKGGEEESHDNHSWVLCFPNPFLYIERALGSSFVEVTLCTLSVRSQQYIAPSPFPFPHGHLLMLKHKKCHLTFLKMCEVWAASFCGLSWCWMTVLRETRGLISVFSAWGPNFHKNICLGSNKPHYLCVFLTSSSSSITTYSIESHQPQCGATLLLVHPSSLISKTLGLWKRRKGFCACPECDDQRLILH